jgi:hypothetical protein
MESISANWSQKEKICSLQFDETAVANDINYDVGSDKILGPHKKIQFVQVQGILSNWKQICYLEFDQDMTSEILEDIIKKLYNHGKFIVKSIVSDNAPTNVKLWTELKPNSDDFSFKHPITKEPIFIFSDAPHWMKLMRNHAIDGGYISAENKIISINPIIQLVSKCKNDNLFHLQPKHLEVRAMKRQNVRLAGELLSNKTAESLKQNFPNDQDAAAVAQFCKIANDVFDVFNSGPNHHSNPLKAKFTSSSEQLKALETAEIFFGELRKINLKGVIRQSLLPFQNGVLMSIRSLRGLWNDLRSNFGIDYLATRQLNSDSLESVFSCLRDFGLDDTPGPLSLIQRTKLHILCTDTMTIKSGVNVEERDACEFSKFNGMLAGYLKELKKPEHEIVNSVVDEVSTSSFEIEFQSAEHAEESSPNTAAFFEKVSQKLRNDFTWIIEEQELSHKFLTLCQKLNKIFESVIDEEMFTIRQNVVKVLMERAARFLPSEDPHDSLFAKKFFLYRTIQQVKFFNEQTIEKRRRVHLVTENNLKRPSDTEISTKKLKKYKRNTGNKTFTN